MNKVDEEKLTGHNYDGIQEYDNPLPGWWKWLWIATIAFSGCYVLVAMLAGAQFSPVGEYDKGVLADLKRAGGLLKADAPTLMRLSKDEDSLRSGAAIFATNCVACHNKDGSGLVGPNLTDDFYLNVTKIQDIPDVVTKGRKNGAMPAWGNRLGPNDIVQVSAYAASLRGQNKPGKAKEGQPIAPWAAQ